MISYMLSDHPNGWDRVETQHISLQSRRRTFRVGGELACTRVGRLLCGENSAREGKARVNGSGAGRWHHFG